MRELCESHAGCRISACHSPDNRAVEQITSVQFTRQNRQYCNWLVVIHVIFTAFFVYQCYCGLLPRCCKQTESYKFDKSISNDRRNSLTRNLQHVTRDVIGADCTSDTDNVQRAFDFLY